MIAENLSKLLDVLVGASASMRGKDVKCVVIKFHLSILDFFLRAQAFSKSEESHAQESEDQY